MPGVVRLKRGVQPVLLLVLVLMFLGGPGGVLESCAQNGKKWFGAGLSAFKKGRYEAAQRAFKRAAQENPADAKAHYYQGLVLNRLGRPHPAAISLEKALELDPKLPGVHLHLGISYYKEKRFNRALKKFRFAQRQTPRDGTVYFFMGLAQQGQGRYRQSIPSFQQAGKLDADFQQSGWYYIGKAYYHEKQYSKAGDAFKKAIQLDPASDIARQTRDLWNQMKSGRELEKKHWLKAGVGLEYNSNLISAEQDVISGEGDTGFVFELESGYHFWQQGPYSAEATYDFYQSLFFDKTEFNLQSHSFGLSGNREVNSWDMELAHNFSHNRLGGNGFLNILQLSPGAGRFWSSNHYTRFSYVLEFKSFVQDVNAPRDAVHNSVGFDHYVFFKNQKGFVHLGYRLMNENADGDPFDYLGNRVTVSAKWPLENKYGQIRLKYTFLNRDFKNTTPQIGEERLDRRHTFQLIWTKKFLDHLECKFDFQHMEADSNLPTVDFSENIIFVGASYLF